jgi:hypothetical protein
VGEDLWQTRFQADSQSLATDAAAQEDDGSKSGGFVRGATTLGAAQAYCYGSKGKRDKPGGLPLDDENESSLLSLSPKDDNFARYVCVCVRAIDWMTKATNRVRARRIHCGSNLTFLLTQ